MGILFPYQNCYYEPIMFFKVLLHWLLSPDLFALPGFHTLKNDILHCLIFFLLFFPLIIIQNQIMIERLHYD